MEPMDFDGKKGLWHYNSNFWNVNQWIQIPKPK